MKGTANGNDIFDFSNSNAGDGNGQLRQLECGNGNDTIGLHNVTGAQINLGVGENVVTLSGDSDVNLIETKGEGLHQTFNIGDDSSANLILADDDQINITDEDAKANVWAGFGTHTIQNSGGNLMLFVDPRSTSVTINNTVDHDKMQYVEFDLLDYDHLLIGKNAASGDILLSETSAGNVLTGTSVTLKGQTDDTYVQCVLGSAPTNAGQGGSQQTYLQIDALIQAMATMTPPAAATFHTNTGDMYQVSALMEMLTAAH